jgi:hypothetical protein
MKIFSEIINLKFLSRVFKNLKIYIEIKFLFYKNTKNIFQIKIFLNKNFKKFRCKIL